MIGRYSKIFLPTLTGLLLLVLGTVVLADTGSPASITATYDSGTGALSASGTYSGAPTGSNKHVGYALFTNGSTPKTPGTGSLDGVNTNTMHLISPATASGSWSDNSHTLTSAPETVCVVIYDVETNKIGDDGNHSDIPAGSDRNKDNSWEKEIGPKDKESYGAGACTTPTIISPSPTPPPVGGPDGGPSVGGQITTPSCPSDRPQQVDQVWFTNIQPGQVTVNWANKGDAAGFHIAYGPSQNNLIWGVEINDGKASQYTLQNLPGGDLWVAVIAKSSAECGGPSSPTVKVGAVGPQVLGATGIAQSAMAASAGLGLIALGLWQAQNALARREKRA